jgi:cytochrome o ubiquinol oxidase subunit IV
MEKSLTSRVIGFAASLVLTLAAFLIILRPDLFHFEIKTAIVVIFVLAVLQFAIQSFCFLHIWKEKGTRWNTLVFFSTLSIILIIILFSIWVMDHLNEHMMVM